MRNLSHRIFLAVGLLAVAPIMNAQETSAHVMIPKSNEPYSGVGPRTFHTNLRVLVPAEGPFYAPDEPTASGAPPVSGLFYETPASIACVYHLVEPHVPGCNPNVVTANPSGGGGLIAIVDAYDDPTAISDLAYFSKQFGLPFAPTTVTVVYASGTQPAVDPTGGWEVEEALDLEWAHAMAPNAAIVLVEAASNKFSDLLTAVEVASDLAAKAGGGDVSMSWGGSEFAQETLLDAAFTTPGVVYFASTGDSPGTSWPSSSPNVIAAGGTSLSRNQTTGSLLFENVWQETGGGLSRYETRPGFQDGIQDLVGTLRGTPDLSFDSNPHTGVWVFTSSGPTHGPAWFIVGGTSVASPSLAGIVNAAGGFRASSQGENAVIYSNSDESRHFHDVTYGNCGRYMGNFAEPGWDFCTGVGSPRGYKGK
jgi:subtilase family serine protease